MLWTSAHRFEYPRNVILRNVLVEQVTHGVYEHSARLLPAPRQIQEVSVQRDGEAVPIAVAAHGFQALSHALGVAVLASLADLRATRDRIPRHFRPFDV